MTSQDDQSDAQHKTWTPLAGGSASFQLVESAAPHDYRVHGLSALWEIAAQCPYYAPLIAENPTPVFDTATGALDFPITRKDALRAAPEGFCPDQTLPDYVMWSGGGSGNPAFVYSDADWLDDLYADRAANGDPDAPMPLTVGYGAGSQGVTPVIPGRVGRLSVPLRAPKNYAMLRQILHRSFQFAGYTERVTQLSLPLPALKKLTHYLLQEGENPIDLPVTRLLTFSHYLSPSWRARLEEMWRAEVIDAYGMTEVRAARAYSCADCGSYHFAPGCLPEVVDVVDETPVFHGRGKLLVTTLAEPGKRFSPVLIRYDTDDLLEIGPFCPRAGSAGVRPVGKIPACARLTPDHPPFLGLVPADVLDAIDADPLVGRYEAARFGGVTRTADDSLPVWAWTLDAVDDAAQLTIEIEVKFSPALFPDIASVWAETVAEKLTAVLRSDLIHPSRDGFEAAAVTVAPVAPGVLDAPKFSF